MRAKYIAKARDFGMCGTSVTARQFLGHTQPSQPVADWQLPYSTAVEVQAAARMIAK
jgi:hypothetical protein